MKNIFIIIANLVGFLAVGQAVKIDTFRLKESEFFKDMQSDKMNFPIINSGNEIIDVLINTDLKNRFTRNEYLNESIDSALIKWSGDQIVFLDFEVTYNQNNVLSINISAEGCGAYCSSWTDYFNYSTKSGKCLTISDFIDTTGEFKAKVYEDRVKQYSQQKKVLREILNEPESGLDTSTYEWAFSYYKDCEKNFDFESFSIYTDRLKIIEDCYLPNAIKNLTPIIDLTYKFSEISAYLKMNANLEVQEGK